MCLHCERDAPSVSSFIVNDINKILCSVVLGEVVGVLLTFTAVFQPFAEHVVCILDAVGTEQRAQDGLWRCRVQDAPRNHGAQNKSAQRWLVLQDSRFPRCCSFRDPAKPPVSLKNAFCGAVSSNVRAAAWCSGAPVPLTCFSGADSEFTSLGWRSLILNFLWSNSPFPVLFRSPSAPPKK